MNIATATTAGLPVQTYMFAISDKIEAVLAAGESITRALNVAVDDFAVSARYISGLGQEAGRALAGDIVADLLNGDAHLYGLWLAAR